MHIELVRVLEDLLVAVGRQVGGNDALTLLDGPAADLEVLLGDAADGHGRSRVEPAELFDEAGDDGGVALEFFELGGVLKEGYDALCVWKEERG